MFEPVQGRRAQDFGKKRFDITIRDDDNKPLWLIRPGRNVDIAVVPLPIDPNDPVVNLHPINKLTTTDLGVFIGLDVFVLGYPFGLEPPGYPVWKRGSIASEPDLVRKTYDYLLVDTASRPGMSGGPVILSSLSNHIMEDGSNRPLDSTPLTRFRPSSRRSLRRTRATPDEELPPFHTSSARSLTVSLAETAKPGSRPWRPGSH